MEEANRRTYGLNGVQSSYLFVGKGVEEYICFYERDLSTKIFAHMFNCFRFIQDKSYQLKCEIEFEWNFLTKNRKCWACILMRFSIYVIAVEFSSSSNSLGTNRKANHQKQRSRSVCWLSGSLCRNYFCKYIFEWIIVNGMYVVIETKKAQFDDKKWNQNYGSKWRLFLFVPLGYFSSFILFFHIHFSKLKIN